MGKKTDRQENPEGNTRKIVNLVAKCEDCGEEREVCLYLQSRRLCLACRKARNAQLPPLPETRGTRREFVLEIAGTKYRFTKKQEARRVARRLLKTRRLPPEIAQAINNAWRDHDEDAAIDEDAVIADIDDDITDDVVDNDEDNDDEAS